MAHTDIPAGPVRSDRISPVPVRKKPTNDKVKVNAMAKTYDIGENE